MSGFIGWLDYSEAEQRQVHEMLQLFVDKGTVDDLGVGTIRDAISNRLFPGTSIIQTRARYFLFIPWIFQRAETDHRRQLLVRADAMERKLIESLRNSDDQDGLIGRQAGTSVRTLPSAIYWSGLAAYDIFQQSPLTRAQYARAARTARPQTEHEDELADRATGFWRPGIPDPPEGFFSFTSAEFRLTREEAEWLSERVLSTEYRRGPNLLGDYVAQLRSTPSVPEGHFWDEPLPESAVLETRELVAHAKQFSSAVQGASLLYNLMLTEARGDGGGDDESFTRDFRAELEVWADEARLAGTAAWAGDVGSFWAVITTRSRVPGLTRVFVDSWCHLLAKHPLDGLADNHAARTLVRAREQQHKGAQARFGNPARLKSWGGNSGTAPLEFRWSQVRRFLTDLATGLHGTALPVKREVDSAAH